MEHQSSVKMDEIVLSAIYGYYVKYDKLTELINKEFVGSNATTLNLFIDVNNILCKIEEFAIKNNTYPSNDLVIMAGLINMAAHYRQFFKTRYSCATKIWLINSLGNCISPLYDKSFAYTKLNPQTHNCKIDSAIMHNTCNYIYDIHYMETSVEFTTSVSYVLSLEEKVNPSIAITKDPFAYQLCANKDIRVLRPSKFKGQDNSYLINNSNAVQYYGKSIKADITDNFTADILAVIMAMSRVPSRGVNSIHTITKALEYLRNAIHYSPSLAKYPWDPEKYFSLVSEANNHKLDKDIPFLINRFKAIECVYFQLLGYKSMPEHNLYGGIINLFDPRGMQYINETYFKDYPLDLEVL